MKRYEIEGGNPFYGMACSILENEIHPAWTVTFCSEVDLAEVQCIRQASAAGLKPSYTAFVVKALALALQEFPYANRRPIRQWWWPFSTRALQAFTHSDVAVACERNVPGAEMISFVDVIRDADRRTLEDLTAQFRQLATCDETNNRQWREFQWITTRLPRWLAQTLVRLPVYFPSLWVKYRGGAALVSSPAKYGVDAVLGSWHSPLGMSFGLVKDRPVVRQGHLVVTPTFCLALNWDRRVMAGAQAARFFARIVDILERAESEMAPYLDKRASASQFLPEKPDEEVIRELAEEAVQKATTRR